MDEVAGMLQSLSIERAQPRPKLWSHWLALAAMATSALLAPAAAWYFLSQPLASPTSAPSSPVPVAYSPDAPRENDAPVGRDAGALAPRETAELVASGYLVARRKAMVAAEVTGKVVDLLIEEGDVVPVGKVLARLDSAVAESDLASARSREIAADAAATAINFDLRDAERILERTQTLAKQGFSTEADLTKTSAKVEVLRANLNQANAQIETARIDVKRSATLLEQHSIRAPFSGVIVERSAQLGEMLSANSSEMNSAKSGLCTLVDMDSIEIEVDVNEAFIGRVNKGGPVNAVLDAYPDWTIPATVIAIVPTANRDKATVKVRIGFKQKDPRFLPDMAVKVTFLEDVATAAAPADNKIGLH